MFTLRGRKNLQTPFAISHGCGLKTRAPWLSPNSALPSIPAKHGATSGSPRPRLCGTTPSMKTRILTALVVLASAAFLFAQADQVKGKAKDLKKKIEGQQTNQVQQPNPSKK